MQSSSVREIYTIGHSTKSFEEFLSLLERNEIKRLVDVRSSPGSKRYPHFNKEIFSELLAARGILYDWLPALGGRRKPTKDSPNSGWRNKGFQGYADYMKTTEFKLALAQLETLADDQSTAVMCAEAVPWRCHRSLISDALIVRGWTVLEIISEAKPKTHSLTKFAVVRENTELEYPPPVDSLPSPEQGNLFKL